MLPPPLGERGGYPHSCRRGLPNDFEKEGFNRALLLKAQSGCHGVMQLLSEFPVTFCEPGIVPHRHEHLLDAGDTFLPVCFIIGHFTGKLISPRPFTIDGIFLPGFIAELYGQQGAGIFGIFSHSSAYVC
jgi:hypothetical protein